MGYAGSESFAELLLTLMREEAKRLGAAFAIEHHRRGNVTEEISASVTRGEKAFRITMQYVRNDAIRDHYLPAGWAHIETDWELRLRPDPDPANAGHFLWYRQRSDENETVPSLVDESWLRGMIREKLA